MTRAAWVALVLGWLLVVGLLSCSVMTDGAVTCSATYPC